MEIKIKFRKSERDGSPISDQSGKIILPDRYSKIKVAAGSSYVGTIKEFERFFIFKPIRLTHFREVFSCGHLIIEEGSIYDKEEARGYVCPKCRAEKDLAEKNQQEKFISLVYAGKYKIGSVRISSDGYWKSYEYFIYNTSETVSEFPQVICVTVNEVDEGHPSGQWAHLYEGCYNEQVRVLQKLWYPCRKKLNDIIGEIRNFSYNSLKENKKWGVRYCFKCGSNNIDFETKKESYHSPESPDGYRGAKTLDYTACYQVCGKCGHKTLLNEPGESMAETFLTQVCRETKITRISIDDIKIGIKYDSVLYIEDTKFCKWVIEKKENITGEKIELSGESCKLPDSIFIDYGFLEVKRDEPASPAVENMLNFFTI